MANATPIDAILGTLTALAHDLNGAQRGPMEPRLRSELERLAKAAQRSASQLAAGRQAAADQVAAKKQQAAVLAAANKAAIKEKQAGAQRAPTEPPKAEAAPIDPTLGRRLAQELLGRQPKPAEKEWSPRGAGVLDDWDLSPAGAVVAQ